MDIESEEGIRSVVLRRSCDTSGMGLGLGFSIMGGAGYDFPPVIYGIEKDSPAAISGMLEAGDVILSINEREVVKLSTKEVLKCLRLSGDIVHIKFKRDSQVVNRVRQFLSTPANYPDTFLEDNHQHHHHFHHHLLQPQHHSPSKNKSSSNKKGSHIPVFQYQQLQPNQNQLSPHHLVHHHQQIAFPSSPINRASHQGHNNQTGLVSCTTSTTIDEVDHISLNNRQNSGHISFTDELFINHSFQHQSQQQHISSSSPSHKPNKGNNKVPQPFAKAPHQHQQTGQMQQINEQGKKNGQRKTYEAFVMTGDAILNVSRNDSNDAFKASPTKTTSKLMPMPHMPIFVERDKDYQRRLQLEKGQLREREKEKEMEKDKSESETASPPLPPPPPTPPATSSAEGDGGHSYSSDKNNKSDQLPPPPPEIDVETEDDEAPLLMRNGISSATKVVSSNGVDSKDGAGSVNPAVHNSNNTPNRCPHSNLPINSVNNNNEDTSISSSVMSDSGDELVGGDDEDVQRMLAPAVASSAASCSGNSKAPLKSVGKKYSSSGESCEGETAVLAEKGHEKERYNEYILFNGSRGTLNEDDYSGRQSLQHHSYSQAVGKGEERTAQSPEDRDLDDDESTSENDVIGAGYDRFGGTGSHLYNDGSFSGSGGESDSSDVESMRLAPVTKAVDIPSAERLAKRLFQLDGFKTTDVWRHLSKNTDFNRVVATEYLNFFTFKGETLDLSLRKFLAVCPLKGETQDRERVLAYFSARYVECNPDTFGSQDSVHTLACALMLLNTDMYSGLNSGRRMTCSEFIENLSGLNDGGDFPRDVLKQLYLSIRSQPLVSPSDADDEDSNKEMLLPIDPPVASSITEFKKGYLVRKSTHEFGGKKTPLGKRSWKMFFTRLKELLLVLSPDEVCKTPTPPTLQIKLHHAFATVAGDYRKRRNVLRLILADRTQFLFQSSDQREMHSWIDMINWNAGRFSSPALEAPVSSSGRFERPLLPSCITRMTRREQLAIHQEALGHWEKELEILTQPKKKGSSSGLSKESKERLIFYQYEMKRYRTYIDVLEKKGNLESSGDKVTTNGSTSNGGGNGNEDLMDLPTLPNPDAVLLEEDS